MIKHIWSVLSESDSIDSETNKVSLFNLLDSVIIFGDPEEVKGVGLKFVVMSLWERSEEAPCEGHMRIFQQKPSGEKSDYFLFEIDLKKSHFHRTRIKFNGMPLDGPGRYVFVVEYKEGDGKWKKVSELPLLIHFEAKPEQES